MDDESEILGYDESWEDGGNEELDYDIEQQLLGEDDRENDNLGEEHYDQLQEDDEEDVLEVSGNEFEEADTSMTEQQEKLEPTMSGNVSEKTVAPSKDSGQSVPKQFQQRPPNPRPYNSQPMRGGHFARFPRPPHNIRHFQERPPHFGFRMAPPSSKRLFINPHYKGRVAIHGNHLAPTNQLGPCFLQPLPRFRNAFEGPRLHAPPPNLPRTGPLMSTPLNVPPPPFGANQQPRIPSLMDLRPHPPNFNRPPPPISRFPPPGLLSPPNFTRNPPPHVMVPPFRQHLPARPAHERTTRVVVPAKRTGDFEMKEESPAEKPVKKMKLEEAKPSDSGTAAATKSSEPVAAADGLVDQDYLKKMEEQKRKREEILKMKELRRKEKFAAANGGEATSNSGDILRNGNEEEKKRAILPEPPSGENRITTVLTTNRPALVRPPAAVPVRHQQHRQPVPRHAVPPLRMSRPPIQQLPHFQGPPPPLPGSLAGLPRHMNGLPPLLPEPHFPSDTVSIENLGKGSTEAQVMVLCGPWGPIEDLYLKPMERKAVVKFPSIQAAVVFRQTHNGASVNGSILRVNFV